MKAYNDLLEGNEKKIKEKLANDPEFYKRSAEGQQPNFLWLGCSDSRVPANEITDTESGDIFVHRNIANMVIHTDLNFMSVLEYAVEHLKVRHVIVCGHYGCGGVQAAMGNGDLGLLNGWLRTIKDVYATFEAELDAIPDEKKRMDRLVELNVAAQLHNVAKTAVVQKAWKDRQLYLHGWVFELASGKIHDLGIDVSGVEGLPHMFKLK